MSLFHFAFSGTKLLLYTLKYTFLMVRVNSKKLCKYELIISIVIAGTWTKHLLLLSLFNNHNLCVIRRIYDTLLHKTRYQTDR